MSSRHLALVRLLADGRQHTGPDIAARFGISRAAVAKTVQALAQRWDLEITATRGQGYRLCQPLELLDAARIQSTLAAAVRARLAAIEVWAEIDSTNAELLRRGHDGAPSGLVCLAERQLAGRGRHGRLWVSPFGRNCYLSILWRTALPPAALGGLSLAGGVAVVAAIQAAAGPIAPGRVAIGLQEIGLKWPNDLHWRRRKLAGLLVEVSGEAQGPSQVVLGVGINLGLGPVQGTAIDQPWVDLEEIVGPGTIGRNALAAALIGQLVGMFEGFERDGLAAFIDDWRRLDRYCGEVAELQLGSRCIQGTLAGIDADGLLLLDTGDGCRRLHGGEIRLRACSASAIPEAGAEQADSGS
ncbi:MAG: biotin--[acetyl-CoA-carboxylase] ligase [Chromatiaceae bacterium]|nr:MAG: biotin--[acetyl-CoA-carboxylase] ligase [Chromatiaceae bacterium]